MRSSRVPFSWTAGWVYSSATQCNSQPREGLAMAALTRGDFLLTSAAASGTALASLDTFPALAQAPKKGGTLRVGFYIEAATMDPHFSGSKIDRQVYHNIYEPLVTLDVKL